MGGWTLQGQNQKLQTDGPYWQQSRLQKGWRVMARDKILGFSGCHLTNGSLSCPICLGERQTDPGSSNPWGKPSPSQKTTLSPLPTPP